MNEFDRSKQDLITVNGFGSGLLVYLRNDWLDEHIKAEFSKSKWKILIKDEGCGDV